MRFLLHQSIVSKCFQSKFYYDWTLIIVVDTGAYYILSSHKLRYERCLKLIYRCLSDDICNEPTHKKIIYREIIYVYEKDLVLRTCLHRVPKNLIFFY
jgi:hypothetical protein